MPPISTFYIVALAATVSTILVPYVARLSGSIGGLDVPDDRKIHSGSISRLGGIAIFCGFLLSCIMFMELHTQIRGILAGAIVIFLTGLVDDLSGLTPRQKFAGQFLAAGIVIFMGGVCVRHLGTPFGLDPINLGLLAVPFTLLGIVGLINAINLLDGLDGLAGGVCAIACISFAIIGLNSVNPVLLSCSAALLGALIGFLRHNTYPAKVFMGDSGSQLLGYFMGVFSVLAATEGQLPVSPYIPLTVLGVPILDTLVVMVNRRLKRKRLFEPDKTHLHHRLLELGVGHRFTVLIVYGVTYLLNIIAILGGYLSDTILLCSLMSITILLYLILRYLMKRGDNLGLSLKSNLSLRRSIGYRRLVRQSGVCGFLIKYLIIALLLLPALICQADLVAASQFTLLLLSLSILILMFGSSWQNQLLQLYIYMSGAYMIFVVEFLGRDDTLLGVSLINVSHGLFALLLVCVLTKTLLRNRAGRLVTSPLEYLIMLVVLSIPMLPAELTSDYHVQIIAAKSVILFVAFKLILMHQMKRNRRVLLAIAVTCLILVLRQLSGS